MNQDADATLTENVMVDYALTLSSAKESKMCNYQSKCLVYMGLMQEPEKYECCS